MSDAGLMYVSDVAFCGKVRKRLVHSVGCRNAVVRLGVDPDPVAVGPADVMVAGMPVPASSNSETVHWQWMHMQKNIVRYTDNNKVSLVSSGG